MKISKMLTLITSTAGLFMFSVVNGASAKTIDHYIDWNTSPKIHTYPKKMRGVWYSYDKYDGITKTHIYKHKMTFSISKKHKGTPSFSSSPLHKYVNHDVSNPSKEELKKKQNWGYIRSTFNTQINGIKRHWINVYGWYQSAGDGANYNVSKIHGRKVFTIGDGAGNWIVSHNYRSAKLAKKLAHKHYNGFVYQTSNGNIVYGIDHNAIAKKQVKKLFKHKKWETKYKKLKKPIYGYYTSSKYKVHVVYYRIELMNVPAITRTAKFFYTKNKKSAGEENGSGSPIHIKTIYKKIGKNFYKTIAEDKDNNNSPFITTYIKKISNKRVLLKIEGQGKYHEYYAK